MIRLHLGPVVLLALLGCGMRPAPPPNTRPTAFFEWCAAEKFGQKSPKAAWANRSFKDVASGEIGFTEYRGVVLGMTEEAAKKSLSETADALTRTAQEKGVTVQGGGAEHPPDADGFVLVYRSGRNEGTLEGTYETDEVKEGDKAAKAYFLKLRLTEVIREP